MSRLLSLCIPLLLSTGSFAQGLQEYSPQTQRFLLSNNVMGGSGLVTTPIQTEPRSIRVYTYYLFSQLHGILSTVERTQPHVFSDLERQWLNGLIDYLPHFSPQTGEWDESPQWLKHQRKLVFVNPTEKPIFDLSDKGTHRLAVTGSTPGSVIYMNDAFFTGDIWTNTKPAFENKINKKFIRQILSLLVHETTHHLGAKDNPELSLDQFGNKVADIYLNYNYLLSFSTQGKSSSHLVAINNPIIEGECEANQARVLLESGPFLLDITQNIKDSFYIFHKKTISDFCQLRFLNPRVTTGGKAEIGGTDWISSQVHTATIDYSYLGRSGDETRGAIELNIGIRDQSNEIFVSKNEPEVYLNFVETPKIPKILEIKSFPKILDLSKSFEIRVRVPLGHEDGVLLLESRNLPDYSHPHDRTIKLVAKVISKTSTSSLLSFTWPAIKGTVRESLHIRQYQSVIGGVFVPQFIEHHKNNNPLPKPTGSFQSIEIIDCVDGGWHYCKSEITSTQSAGHRFVLAGSRLAYSGKPMVVALKFKSNMKVTKVHISGVFDSWHKEVNHSLAFYSTFSENLKQGEKGELFNGFNIQNDGAGQQTLLLSIAAPRLEIMNIFRELRIKKIVLEDEFEGHLSLSGGLSIKP